MRARHTPRTSHVVAPQRAELDVVVLEGGDDVIGGEVLALVRLASARRLCPHRAVFALVVGVLTSAVALVGRACLARRNASLLDLPDVPVDGAHVRTVPEPCVALLTVALMPADGGLEAASGLVRGTLLRTRLGDVRHPVKKVDVGDVVVRRLVRDSKRVVVLVGLERLARLLIPAVGSDERGVHVALLVLASPIHSLHIVFPSSLRESPAVRINPAVGDTAFKALQTAHIWYAEHQDERSSDRGLPHPSSPASPFRANRLPFSGPAKKSWALVWRTSSGFRVVAKKPPALHSDTHARWRSGVARRRSAVLCG
mmetsp:Transcript_10066/g.20127  ORF Transcript_10066/g.20127 Transcript_10066/m.20127 type:complete len:313 (-) Transcript_10066:144-1082(-)